jgi:hypothetical protein
LRALVFTAFLAAFLTAFRAGRAAFAFTFLAGLAFLLAFDFALAGAFGFAFAGVRRVGLALDAEADLRLVVAFLRGAMVLPDRVVTILRKANESAHYRQAGPASTCPGFGQF